MTPMENAAMQAISDSATIVATLTGMKNQFIEEGWTPEVAEHLVLQIIRSSVQNGSNP